MKKSHRILYRTFHKRNKKKIYFFPLFLLLLLLVSSLPVSAAAVPEAFPEAPEISEETGVLMELETGQILFDKGMNERRYPASTTKIMTALLILENISDLSQKVTFTDVILPDLAPGNSTINAQVGEELTVEQCLYAIMLASANEVCTQMAVKTAGSVENFVAMMNTRAKELGCKDTHFVNANGLPDPNHYTTAYDLALILGEAVKNEAFCTIAGAASYTIPATNKTASPRELVNHNALIAMGSSHYDGVLAGKTGYTNAAQNTLATAARRGNITLICTVMRGTDSNARFTDTAALFDYGFDSFQKYPLYWESLETPAAYVLLPDSIPSGSLLITDTMSEDKSQVTRSYSYQGTELVSVTKDFPLTVDPHITEDMLLLKEGTWKVTLLPSYTFSVMAAILAAESIVFVVLLGKRILELCRKRKEKLNNTSSGSV